MVKQPDLAGPGEQLDPNMGPGELPSIPIADGDLPHTTAERASSTPAPSTPQPVGDQREGAENDPRQRIGTERGAFATTTPFDYATEQRRDRSAGDLRETVFDPAQDNAGPQSDKG